MWLAHRPPGAAVCYAVQLRLLMSQAGMELWLSVAERCRLEVNDVVHAAALGGLKDQLAHDGDAVGAYAAKVYQRAAIARLGLEVCDAHRG